MAYSLVVITFANSLKLVAKCLVLRVLDVEFVHIVPLEVCLFDLLAQNL